jgi:phage shock protein A
MKYIDDLLNCQELGGQKKKECTHCCKRLVVEIKRLRGVIHRTENALHKLQLKYLDLHDKHEALKRRKTTKRRG